MIPIRKFLSRNVSIATRFVARSRDQATRNEGSENGSVYESQARCDGRPAQARLRGYDREQYAYCSEPDIFAHDVPVNYRLGYWNFEGGVNNLFDKKPPFVASASANTAPGLYSEEIIGRYVFLDVSTKF